MAPAKSLEDPRITRKGDLDPRNSPSTHQMVAPRGKCPSRSVTTPTQPCSSDLYRCLKRRLGCLFGRSHSKRDFGLTRKQIAYKLPGTKGGLSGPKRVPGPLFKRDCVHSNRQHHSCCLHKQGVRHEIGSTVYPFVENT